MYDKAVSNGSLIHLYLYPMHLFYQPDIQPISLLSDEEAHHAFHVLRLREGDHIGLLDGTGKRALARIISISKKGVSAEVEEETLTPKPVRNLRLAIAPVKNMDRFEWLAEKATEIGVTVISPVICRRSERKDLKTDRLRKLIIAASKQSQRDWFPVLEEAVSLPDFLSRPLNGDGFIAHCMDGEKAGIKQLCNAENVTVLIGPEGDFDADEVHQAIQKGFHPLSLGDTRLRTETAGLVAVTLFCVNR